MKQGFKVMDSDMPIIEPPDLWQCYVSRSARTRHPRGTTNAVADLGMVGPDGTWGTQHRRTCRIWGKNVSVVTALPVTRRLSHTKTWGGRGTRSCGRWTRREQSIVQGNAHATLRSGVAPGLGNLHTNTGELMKGGDK